MNEGTGKTNEVRHLSPQDAEDAKVRADMQRVARLLDSQLPFGWGFVYLAFPFGQGGRMNYVANADRVDVVRVMYEFIDKSKENWAEHEPELSAAAEDEHLARARQRIAYLEGLLLALAQKETQEKAIEDIYTEIQQLQKQNE